MSNRFWNFITTFTAGTLAKAEDVNTNFSGVNTGLDGVATELDQAIQITNSPGTVNISLNAAARSMKILTFDASGNVEAVVDMGDYQGNHAGAGTAYVVRDIVKDAAGDMGLNNIYRCNEGHTSSASMASDTSKWDVIIDVADVEASATAAAASETAAAASAAAAAASAATIPNQEILQIGDWDMDADTGTQQKTVAHGLPDYTKFRRVTVTILSDGGSVGADFNAYNPLQTALQNIAWNATNIILTRATDGSFDNDSYNSTGFNRGWIVIDYAS